jgi:bifunctional ADP-heptose synthase (sugar kinase/adenylyltransferase)
LPATAAKNFPESHVTVFSTSTPIPLIEKLQNDIYVKGGDYIPEMLAGTAVGRAYGGENWIMHRLPDHSTSALGKCMDQSQVK